LTERRTSLLDGAAAMTQEGAGRQVAIAFTWRHPDGTLGRRFDVTAADPKTSGALDPETIAAIGRSVAVQLATSLGVTPVAPQAPAPGSAEAPNVYIEAVKGAPGDGNRALTMAMSVELATDGIGVTSDRTRARFVLAGVVNVAANPAGTETVKIIWRILSPTGAELAKVEQASAIEKGSLNRSWGDTAYDVANAAADGLLEAYERLTAATKTP
jgi:hypothetical protein